MKAVVVNGERTLTMREVDEPKPQEGSVLVRTNRVGICATDREMVRSNTIYSFPPGDDHLILGHEAVGTIVDAGLHSNGFAVGDLVVPIDYIQCPPMGDGHCAVDLCPYSKEQRRGINSHGFFRPYFREHPRYLVKVPRELADVAMLLEPLTVTLKGFSEAALLRDRWLSQPCAYRPEDRHERVMVIGAGPIGMLGIMLARSYGWETVGVDTVSADAPKARLVSDVGAHYVNAREVSPAEIAKRFGPFDVILEAVQEPTVLLQYIDLLGINGVFVLVGWTAADKEVTLNLAGLIRTLLDKQAAVIATTGARAEHYHDGMASLGAIKRAHADALERTVTGRFPFEQFREGFANVSSDEIKTVIEF